MQVDPRSERVEDLKRNIASAINPVLATLH